MLELTYSSSGQRDGRNFDCQNCPTRIQKLRRCKEDRDDFTAVDGALWPMYVYKGGDSYGFCPGKATWDNDTQELFKIMVLSAETGQLLYPGGLSCQPSWYIDMLSYFIPRHDHIKFVSKAEMVLGGDKKSNKPSPKRSVKKR